MTIVRISFLVIIMTIILIYLLKYACPNLLPFLVPYVLTSNYVRCQMLPLRLASRASRPRANRRKDCPWRGWRFDNHDSCEELAVTLEEGWCLSRNERSSWHLAALLSTPSLVSMALRVRESDISCIIGYGYSYVVSEMIKEDQVIARFYHVNT